MGSGDAGVVSVSWWNSRLAGFDIETTGLDAEEDRIVTAAIVLCSGGEETVKLNWLVDPGIEIPEEATAVHGISTAHAREHGRPAAEAVPEILAALRDASVITPFNTPFDLTFMDREARRLEVEPLVDPLVVDPFVLDKWLHRYRKGSRKLIDMARHYGIRLDEADAHDATADALAAARLAWVMCAKGKPIRRVRSWHEEQELDDLIATWETVRYDVEALHEFQVAVYAEEMRRFREYKQKQGEAWEDIREDWPVVPLSKSREAA